MFNHKKKQEELPKAMRKMQKEKEEREKFIEEENKKKNIKKHSRKRNSHKHEKDLDYKQKIKRKKSKKSLLQSSL